MITICEPSIEFLLTFDDDAIDSIDIDIFEDKIFNLFTGNSICVDLSGYGAAGVLSVSIIRIETSEKQELRDRLKCFIDYVNKYKKYP